MHCIRNGNTQNWYQKNEPDTKRHNSYSRAENKKSEPDYWDYTETLTQRRECWAWFPEHPDPEIIQNNC